jgi:hypothetical protein
MSLHRLPLAATVAALTAAASAGPLDKSRVPADATWIVHVDAEAALECSVVRFILDQHGEDHLGDLDEFKAQFGVDPLNDIKDLTVFGVGTDGEDAVALLTTTAAVDDAIKMLAAQGEGTAKITEGGYELLSWNEHDQVQYVLVRPLGEDRRLVYLSKDKSRLAAAADVGAGRARGLKGREPSALSADPGAGAIVFIASDVIPSHGHHDHASMVLDKARAFRFEAGESGDNLYADLSVTTGSSEDATNVVEILQGLKAMGRMFCQGEPDLAPIVQLADAVKVSADESSVAIRINYSAAAAMEAIKAAENADADDDHDEDDEDDENDEDDDSDEDDEPV